MGIELVISNHIPHPRRGRNHYDPFIPITYSFLLILSKKLGTMSKHLKMLMLSMILLFLTYMTVCPEEQAEGRSAAHAPTYQVILNKV